MVGFCRAPQPLCSTHLWFGKNFMSKSGGIGPPPPPPPSHHLLLGVTIAVTTSAIDTQRPRGKTHLPSTFKPQRPGNEAVRPWRQRGKRDVAPGCQRYALHKCKLPTPQQQKKVQAVFTSRSQLIHKRHLRFGGLMT